LHRKISDWAVFNGAQIEHISHKGSWDALQPIYKGAPPTMSLF
jgi:hypothetical protein